ncbi:cysteine desulfurase family protein [Lachnotalea sp. AF33-28]|uniref:cysteine desulfurase family protein n=1 Tax=Lachnotalea sp. AF33-28 TaxID=2292046 RepID=UPI000E4E3A4A|nr:cysteine desulfurase family protein [Lachnotalea sp. AF33-28]RHP33255.1 cysteine desulfurase [Lachnotalea sp. AF33-28]
MEAYLDNSATTRVFDCVRDVMVQTMCGDYGNPSSLHRKGVDAETYVKESRAAIAASLRVNEKEIYFTSGGTESNNLAIIGCAMANRRAGNHIITTMIEHASVINTMKYLEENGFEITYLPVDRFGMVRVEDVAAAIRRETILVSIMYVNNEMGAVQPVEAIGLTIKKIKPSVIFHVDAIQAFGKFRIRPRRQGIDLLSVSGHKIHGPKGVGFLYVRDRVKIRPIIFGGEQQMGLRSGTENVPGIAGLGAAVTEIYRDHEARMEYLYQLKERFINGILRMEGTAVNGPEPRQGAPHIISVSFEGVRSEVLLHALEDRGVYVSAGSACASNHPMISPTLKAIGVRRDLLESTLRFSMSIFTTVEEIDYTLQVLNELLPMLRRYRRG